MRTVEKVVYKLNELPDNVQETAIEKFREFNLSYEWWDNVYYDVEEIGKLIGIEIDKIYFSGFCSQGDGACFEGSYYYQKQSVKKIMEYAPQDEDLHEIAKELYNIQRKYFYGLNARIKQSGHYMHEMCTQIDVYNDEGDYTPTESNDSITESLRDFMRWIYKRLEDEHDYLQSDEAIKETIEANDYEFDIWGSIY